MFGKRKKELQRKQAIIDSLKAENRKLRMDDAKYREEVNADLEAKEAERLELCDQLGESQELVKVLKAKNERLTAGLKSANRENRFLIKTNAELAMKLNVKPVGRIKSKEGRR
ncbi:MAG: hypothetical protein IKO23_09855 [Bacteroidales bacterium]|nr:hypothetical protein [Bacteroidales bacterium]